MLKYNSSENTKFPNLKFTCKGDKDKLAGITLVLIVLPFKKKVSMFLGRQENENYSILNGHY